MYDDAVQNIFTTKSWPTTKINLTALQKNQFVRKPTGYDFVEEILGGIP